MVVLKPRPGESLVIDTPNGEIVIQILPGGELGVEVPPGISVAPASAKARRGDWLPARPKREIA